MEKKYKGFKLNEDMAKEVFKKAAERAMKNGVSTEMTNDIFAHHDPVFRRACELAMPQVQPTARQAGKYRKGQGAAYAARAAAVAEFDAKVTQED